MRLDVVYRILFILLHLLPVATIIHGIIVDGVKKKDISPVRRQASAKASIDSFNTKTCGIYDENYMEHEFINMAREGQFPWMVSFQIKIPKNSSKMDKSRLLRKAIELDDNELDDLHFCAGSFISDKWILSAAHCFAPDSVKTYLESNKLKAVAGSHKISSKVQINRNLTIERIFLHSQFDNNVPIGFDIALAELRRPVNFTLVRRKAYQGEQGAPFMNAICLPLKHKEYKFNESARVAGWGMSIEKDITSMPSKLLTTDILLTHSQSCAKMYSELMNTDKPKMQLEKYNDFLCAGYKNSRDACQSDSGGPLIQYSDGKGVAIGIVSYGVGCATRGVPGFYTRTSAYINWIREITEHGKKANVDFRVIENTSKSKKEIENQFIDDALTETNVVTYKSANLTTKPSSKLKEGGEESFRFFDE